MIAKGAEGGGEYPAWLSALGHSRPLSNILYVIQPRLGLHSLYHKLQKLGSALRSRFPISV